MVDQSAFVIALFSCINTIELKRQQLLRSAAVTIEQASKVVMG